MATEKKEQTSAQGGAHADNCRILGQDEFIDNDTWVTGISNNDLIIGPTGAGKTRGYVKPNILQANGSMIITDTKGNLRRETGPYLKSRGYHIVDIDFTNLYHSEFGYNPLDYIRIREDGTFNEQDVMTIGKALVPDLSLKEPFWDDVARLYIEALIGYTMACLPKDEQNLNSVSRLSNLVGTNTLNTMFAELEACEPDSFSVSRYKRMQVIAVADRMDASIKGIMFNALNPYNFDGMRRMFVNPKRIDFASIGTEKTAVFLTVSDSDRAMDRLVGLFYTQALQVLLRTADQEFDDCRLPVPVRFILDDFATNVLIPDFDKIISVIRSREISVSLIVQSLSQLDALYDSSVKKTIVNNCDTWLYLGGQDFETIKTISEKMNRPFIETAQMPLDSAALFIRGQKPRFVEKFDLTTHRNYRYLPEAHQKGKEAMELC